MIEDKNLETRKQEMETSEDTERTRTRRAFVPRSDIYETEKEIVLVTDVPGASQENVDITLEKNILTIRAYPVEEDMDALSLIYAEYGIGDYERRFTLSDEIDREKIEAQVKNGVLTLHLPKAEEAKPKRIPVQSGHAPQMIEGKAKNIASKN